eukprot:385830-Pleurochrysis_carterae.AAC.2
MCPDTEKFADDNQEMAMDIDEDDENAFTDKELREEDDEEPLMMTNASRWDRFLAFAKEIQRSWASEAEDTDFYRKKRAVL